MHPPDPLLLPQLSEALSILYSGNPSKEAHDFLVHIQCRNLRRQIAAVQQQARDQPTKTAPPLRLGSTWLACTALLSSPHALFGAQTLVHRLRRMPLVDAVDLEMEYATELSRPDAVGWYQDDSHVQYICQRYQVGSMDAPEEQVKARWAVQHIRHALQQQTSGPLAHALQTVVCLLALRIAPQGMVAWMQDAYCGALLPETILGLRISMDRRELQQAIRNLQMIELEAIWSMLSGNKEAAVLICRNWAKYLALPVEWIRQTNLHDLLYLLAIFEGATWSLDKILGQRLGLLDEFTNKRLSSRSRKKQKGAISRQSSEDVEAEAHREQIHRGEMACKAARLAWTFLEHETNRALQEALTTRQIDGEGPIGCMAACANACLPHIVRHGTSQGGELFGAISQQFAKMCESPNAAVRVMTFESLHSLHQTLLEVLYSGQELDPNLSEAVVSHFCRSALSLASACSYPADYFSQPAAPSSESIELERKDVRDVLRTVSGFGEGGSTSTATSSRRPHKLSIAILSNILQACNSRLDSDQHKGLPLEETLVHAFSALAKPLNVAAKYCASNGYDKELMPIVDLARSFLQRICDSTVNAFQPNVDPLSLLSVARTVCISCASFSPSLASVYSMSGASFDSSVLNSIYMLSILSLETIPELWAPTHHPMSQYDIRGCFKSPGGEDHVGVLALMRLVHENDAFTQLMTTVSHKYIHRLCALYNRLRSKEVNRGVGVNHGIGVAPVSRRILLGVLCRLETGTATDDKLAISSLLERNFVETIDTVLLRQDDATQAAYFEVTERVFDLTYFTPVLLMGLFSCEDATDKRRVCLQAIANMVVRGYQSLAPGAPTSDILVQWNRLRAAVYHLLEKVTSPALPPQAAHLSEVCLRAELEATCKQIEFGPVETSNIFNDDIVSIEAIPAGLWLQLLSTCCLSENRHSNDHVAAVLSRSWDILHKVVLHECPEPTGHSDARPTIFEAWMASSIRMCSSIGSSTTSKEFLLRSAHTVICLLFLPTLSDDTENSPGMSIDGPHSILLIEFMVEFLNLGTTALNELGALMMNSLSVRATSQVPVNDIGTGIVWAALLRATQGALPPWAVESVPELYSSLFAALCHDASKFALCFRVTMDLILDTDKFGGVQKGHLLAGRFFEVMSPAAKDDLAKQCAELASQNDTSGWRRMKQVIKQACGGKKKDLEFRQKPSLTKWDFVRV